MVKRSTNLRAYAKDNDVTFAEAFRTCQAELPKPAAHHERSQLPTFNGTAREIAKTPQATMEHKSHGPATKKTETDTANAHEQTQRQTHFTGAQGAPKPTQN